MHLKTPFIKPKKLLVIIVEMRSGEVEFGEKIRNFGMKTQQFETGVFEEWDLIYI